jgi:hypothetical protein
MTEDQIPEGLEREVKTMGGAAIDGTPIAYIIVLAAVATVLAFIPFLAQAKVFPLVRVFILCFVGYLVL